VKTFATIGLATLVALSTVFSSVAQTYTTGSIVGTNFGFQNRYRWTNDNGQIFTPSNTTIRLSDFTGKIVMFEFFAVW